MPSIPSHVSSSRRSSTPQVNAPCEPPPCSAKSTKMGGRSNASVSETTVVILKEPQNENASRHFPALCRHSTNARRFGAADEHSYASYQATATVGPYTIAASATSNVAGQCPVNFPN